MAGVPGRCLSVEWLLSRDLPAPRREARPPRQGVSAARSQRLSCHGARDSVPHTTSEPGPASGPGPRGSSSPGTVRPGAQLRGDSPDPGPGPRAQAPAQASCARVCRWRGPACGDGAAAALGFKLESLSRSQGARSHCGESAHPTGRRLGFGAPSGARCLRTDVPWLLRVEASSSGVQWRRAAAASSEGGRRPDSLTLTSHFPGSRGRRRKLRNTVWSAPKSSSSSQTSR